MRAIDRALLPAQNAAMITVAQALSDIAAARALPPVEIVPLSGLIGATLAADVAAKVTLPPHDASAMDGYAARFEDCNQAGQTLRVIGEAPAGAPFKGQVTQGDCVRIFTGSVIPDGADTIVIQETVTRKGDVITTTQDAEVPRHIRKAGIDFKAGDILAEKGERLGPAQIALLAASNHDSAQVYRRPRVAIIANGDELRPPGSDLSPGQIINSNPPFLAALIESWGGIAISMGIAADTKDAIKAIIQDCSDADIIVPVGGASVGDHDHMRAAFTETGLSMVFAKIAVKPGKPTWFGRLGEQRVLGLPGNPASAAVCAHLFLRPLITGQAAKSTQARLSRAVAPNGPRESYFRARIKAGIDGLTVTPFPKQDSSLITPLGAANALLKLRPGAAAQAAGDIADVIALNTGPDLI